MAEPILIRAAVLMTALLSGIAVMAILLRRSLHRAFYSYANIGLIGGLLFAAVLFAALSAQLIGALRAGEFSAQHLFTAFLRFPRQFSYGAVLVIVLLCLMLGVSNVALIRHEGFCLNNALSLLVAGFYIGGTALIYWLSDLLTEKVFLPRGLGTDPLFLVLSTVIPLFFLLMLCYFECVLAGTGLLGWAAARRVPKHDKDFIIILGCSIDRRGGLLPLLKGRVNRAVRFAWEQELDTGKSVRYIPSGGQGPNEIMSEGSAMELYLLSHGAEDYEVFPERRSASTWENFLYSRDVIEALQPGAKVAFATTNYHILRSGILARRAGFDAEGIAGDTKWYFWPNGFVREFFAILAMNLRVHAIVAAAAALVCAAVGIAGFHAGLI